MSENNRPKENKGEWKLIDFVIPFFAFALAVYYYYTLRGLPDIAKYYGGTISILIMICFAAIMGIFFKKKIYLQLRSLRGKLHKSEKGINPTLVAVQVLGIALLYVGAIQLIGFTCATFLYLCVMMLFLGRRGIWRVILPAVAVTAVGFILFVVILNLNISLDPISKSLKYLIRGWIF